MCPPKWLKTFQECAAWKCNLLQTKLTEKMATFYIDKDTRNEFRYILKDGNNEVILRDSEGHSTKSACQTSIASVKVNAPIDARYNRLDNSPHYSFTLKGANGERIGVSETYVTQYNRERGIENVKRDAPGASTVDRS